MHLVHLSCYEWKGSKAKIYFDSVRVAIPKPKSECPILRPFGQVATLLWSIP